jgi:adhesin transport system outer membrane protein
LWPDLSLNITQRHGDVTGKSAQVMLQFDSKWGAGLSNQATTKAAIHRHQAKQDDLVYRKQKLQEQIRAEHRALASMRDRIQAYQRALKGARAVAQSWDRQYVAGKKSWQEVMNAAREVTQSHLQLIETESQANTTAWRLAILTQGTDSLVQNP